MPPQHPAVQLLLISGLIIFWLIPLTSWLMLRGQRDVHANLWFLGTALYSLVATLFVFAQFLPAWVTGSLSGTLSLLSVLLMMDSLRREVSPRPAPWRYYAVALLGLLLTLSALMQWSAEEAQWRVTHLLIISLVELHLVALTNRIRRQKASQALWVVMATFGVFAACNLARVVEWWISGRFSTLLAFTTLSNISLTVNYLSAIFYCYGYWGFVVEKNRQQLIQATEQAVVSREQEKLAIERERMAQHALQERTELMSRLAMVGKHAQSGALSASIAHELNQPLASIQLNIEESQRIAQSQGVTAPLAALLTRIEQDNQRAALIVRRVRDMFSQGSQRQEPLVLDEVVRQISEWLHRRLTLERITLDLQLNAPSAFPFPSGEMEHILMNLLDNALHAVSQSVVGDRRITVKTWTEHGWVCLSVADNGPGVPEHLQDKIFDLSQSSKPEGMGLGLWLARYLVERQGGQLGLTTVGTTGACFSVKLPLQ